MRLGFFISVLFLASNQPFFSQAVACPAGTRVVGHVQSSMGRAELKRPGLSNTQLVPLQPVCETDVIDAAANSATRIRLLGRIESDRDGSEILNILGPSRHVLPSLQRGSSAIDNIVAMTFDRLLPNLTYSAKQATARAGQPARWITPGLSSVEQSLNPGRRALSFAWRGGSGPFQLKIFNQDGTLASSQSSRQRELTMPSQDWALGSYDIKLYSRDEQIPFLSARFRVAPLELPQLDAAINEMALGTENLAALRALDMTRTDPSRFSFEAGQLLSAAPEEGLDREFVLRSIANYSLEATPTQIQAR